LGAIVARAESARSELGPESSAADDVEHIRMTAMRAAEIVSQLMTFAGQESATPTAIDLSGVVAEMLDLLKVSIGKMAVLTTDLGSDLLPVRASAAEMRQVVMNLMLNASEALEGKPGSIKIVTARGELRGWQGEAVRLEVQDSGTGMTQEVKARIFDP